MERDYAKIGIAHRLSTVKNADRIYSVDAGEIVETGEYEELIGKGGSMRSCMQSNQKSR
mgnify:FL=1